MTITIETHDDGQFDIATIEKRGHWFTIEDEGGTELTFYSQREGTPLYDTLATGAIVASITAAATNDPREIAAYFTQLAAAVLDRLDPAIILGEFGLAVGVVTEPTGLHLPGGIVTDAR